MKIVGVKIDTKSLKTKEKVYYYKTDQNFKPGDKINIKVESGGSPKAVVVASNSDKKNNYNLKKLEIIE